MLTSPGKTMAEILTQTPWSLQANESSNSSTVAPLGNPVFTNVSQLAPSIWLEANAWMWKTFGIPIIVLGTFGNTMSILVLRRLRSSGQSPLNVYLTGLAVTDTVCLYLSTGERWARYVLHVNVFAHHDLGCKLGYWVLNFSAAISSWFLVAMTIQRAASVTFPHRVNVLCTTERTKVIVGVISGVWVLVYSHMLYGVEAIGSTCGIRSPSYRQFFVNTWVTVDLVCYSLLPFALLFIINTVLVRKLLASISVARSQLSTTENSKHHETHRKKRASSTTLTVVVVSGTFLLFSSPVVTFNTISSRHGSSSGIVSDPEKNFFLHNLFFMLGSVNFAVNFYLYCLTGTKFRRSFLDIVSCCRSESAKKSRAPPAPNMGQSTTIAIVSASLD